MNFFMLNKKLFKTLEGKFIIFGAGYKGGIGKSVISLGLAKEFNIPYITNDQGSAISGNIEFYKHTYLTYDFISDEKLEESKIVIIDLAGCFFIDKTILKLIKESNLIILPTGENPYLDHTGCLITADNLYNLNKNIMFVTTGIENDKLKDTMFSFNKIKLMYPNFEKLKLFGLSKCNEIINDSLLKKRSYLRTYLSLSEEKKDEFKPFIKDWARIVKEVKLALEEHQIKI
ncbi:MAG: hypothetical protein PHG81_11270 [Aliarcobacter sp.]|nr:hypothetical protein [Aliarcobacter sp.]